MTLARTWATQVINVALDTSSLDAWHADWMLHMKKFITGASPVAAAGAWSVYRSCNGVSYGAADYWNATSDIIWSTGASPYSWIVFKSPPGFMPNGAFVYLMIACKGANSAALIVRASGAPWTGGDLTNYPINVNSPAMAINENQFQSLVLAGAASFHATRNTFGDFIILGSKNGQGIAHTALTAFSLGNAQPADAFPFLFSASIAETNSGGMDRTKFTFGGGGNSTMLWIGGQRLPDGDGQGYVNMPRNVGDSQSWLNTVAVDSIDPSKIPAWPCHVTTNGTTPAYRGRIVDVDLVGLVGQLTPSPAGSQERCVVGGFLIPFTVSPTF